MVGPANVAAALVLVEQAKQAGVEVKLRQVDAATFAGPARRDWQVSTGGTLGVPWLSTALHIDAPSAVANKTNFHDPRFTALFDQALAQPDLAARSELVHRMQRIQHDEGGLLIWGFANTLDGVGPRVGGSRRSARTSRPGASTGCGCEHNRAAAGQGAGEICAPASQP
ncbi:hypothetical protein ACFSLT_23370 [Novosphingobium resinovorum]